MLRAAAASSAYRSALMLGIGLFALLAVSCQREATPEPLGANPSPGMAITPTATPTPDPKAEFLKQFRVEMQAQPVEGSVEISFTARIVGGPDSSPELHCQGERWDFGDGKGTVKAFDCPGWEPKYKTLRLFTEVHVYETPGTYTVRFTYGPLEGSATVQVGTDGPEGWTQVEARSSPGRAGFSVYLPPGWKLRNLQGIDSYVGEITGDGVRLTFDYGMYSNTLPYEKDPAYEVQFETIGIREAKLVRPRETKGGITGVYFAELGNEGSCQQRSPIQRCQLNIIGKDLTRAEQDLAWAIFRTVGPLAGR